ncbi:CRTAC1 family protein [Ascidiimonas sp. W6]|uniref:CRTAC1 family protein n=1 Tax=Ascidiimonas meishanensis TaxID=3128903 RepID=UPI0030EEA38F
MKQAPRIVSILILIIIYAFTIPSDISLTEREELAKEFAFERSILYYPKGLTSKVVRDVHPQYKDISTWISSVGAAVAITDFDGDNLPNDIVHVDPRFDKVFVSPATGTGNRFMPFELEVSQLPFNTKTMAATGVLTNDFNADGKMDFLVYYLGRTPVIFYQKENGFEEAELIEGEKWNTTTATIADLDGDGYPDILIGNYFPDESKLLEADATDTDQIMQHSMSRGDNGGRNRIFLWSGLKNGKVVFKEDTTWSDDLPYPYDWTLAVAAGDINNDLLPEIYVANDFGPDKLLLNQSTPGNLKFTELKGRKGFTTTRSNVIGLDSFKGMGVDFGDINGDGLMDIYVSNIADDWALHESHFVFVNTGETDVINKGIAPFENKSEVLGLSRSSWAWEAKLIDFNNDGVKEAIQGTGFVKGDVDRWPELQELATSNDEVLTNVKFWPKLVPGDDVSGDSHIPFFVKHSTGKYYDLAANLGLDDAQITRGIAISDIDHDGKLDFVSANQWEDSKLYKNTGVNPNSFLGLSIRFPIDKEATSKVLVDSKIPGRYALGAFAKLTLKDGTKQIAFVDGGNGHAGGSSSDIHFGLGKHSKLEDIKVTLSWRDGNGDLQEEELSLKPGWHDIILPL